MFLLYINDITRSTNKLNFLLYADDTTLFLSGSDINEMTKVVTQELISVANWIKSNTLTLNIDKTSFMVSHPLMSQTPNLMIIINNILIKQVNEVKFLGVTLDNLLKWKSHIDTIKTKLSRICGIMYRTRNYMNTESRKQIYLSLGYPHLLYCCALWGGAYVTFINSLC